MAPLHESVKLAYLEWQDLYEREKPFQLFINLPDDAVDTRTTNLVFKDGEQQIGDIRGSERIFSLNENGFTFINHKSTVTSFASQESIGNEYLPEVESLLRAHIEDADRIFIFDWRIRRSDPGVKVGESINFGDRLQHLLPARHVHVDQSAKAVVTRIRIQLKEDAEELLKGRVRVINVWRPISDPIEDWPLAVCDGSTVSPSDLVRTDHVRRHYTGETLYATYNKNHRWYYMSRQRKDEVLIIKNFDSANVKARFCPHASFRHTEIRADAPRRESIEVRALVFSSAV